MLNTCSSDETENKRKRSLLTLRKGVHLIAGVCHGGVMLHRRVNLKYNGVVALFTDEQIDRHIRDLHRKEREYKKREKVVVYGAIAFTFGLVLFAARACFIQKKGICGPERA